MPHPFSRIVPDARIALKTDALADKPEMAILVTEIFSVWASIEHELSLLLVRVLGAEHSPAIAIFSILTAQHLQNKALEAAAKEALSPEALHVFLAVLSVVESAQTNRNRLAHWIWARCEQRPDLLALANPKMIKERDLKITEHLRADPLSALRGLFEMVGFDNDHVIGYSKDDLERAKSDLTDAQSVLLYFEFYLNPQIFKSINPKAHAVEIDHLRSLALELLNDKRLFREAMARIQEDQKNNRQPPPISPELRPDET